MAVLGADQSNTKPSEIQTLECLDFSWVLKININLATLARFLNVFFISGFVTGSEELHRKLADSQKIIEKQSLEIKDLHHKLALKQVVSTLPTMYNNIYQDIAC